MIRKLLFSIILGMCIFFMSTGTIYANQEEMFQKQAEIDKVLFEEKSADLVKNGITVTHTVALEDKIEIGITDYSDEKAKYLLDLFGENKVKVVAGEQAVALGINDGPADNSMVDTKNKKETSNRLYYAGAGVIVIAAGIMFVLRKKLKTS